MTKSLTPTLPAVDFPGEWRWKCNVYSRDGYRLRLQRKRWYGWQTMGSKLFWPTVPYVPNTPEAVVDIVVGAARDRIILENYSLTQTAKETA